MISAPIAPSSGDKISASWTRALVNYVRAIKPIAGPGIRTFETPNGTILSCPVKPRPAAKSDDHGCWNISTDTKTVSGTEKTVHVFVNQYYMSGEHKLNELQLEATVEDFVLQGSLENGNGEDEDYTEADRPFVCLRVPATAIAPDSPPALVGYKTIAEVQAAQRDVSYVVRPLYKFDHYGRVLVDFRNCPSLQVAEAL